MSVYTLSPGGLNVTQLPGVNIPLVWVKLLIADNDPKSWTVQTFAATNLQDGSANDQAETFVYFSQGGPPPQSPLISTTLSSSLVYDIAVPVGSAVELDSSVDWYVAYPAHGQIFANGAFSGPLLNNQFVTLVVTRFVQSIYEGSENSPTGDSLSTPLGGTLLVQTTTPDSVPASTFFALTWTTTTDPVSFLYYTGISVKCPVTQSTPSTTAPGVFHIDLNVVFNPNNTGNRYVALAFVPISKNGLFVPNTAVKVGFTGMAGSVLAAAGAGANGGALPLQWTGYIPANTYIYVIVYQDSGAALSVLDDRTTLQIRQIG